MLLCHIVITVRHPDRAIFNADAGRYADVGRQIARTARLNARHTWPGQLTHPIQPPFPVLGVGFPLVSMLDGALFKLGGERAEWTLIPPAIAYLVLVGLTALLALRMSGSVTAGLLAGTAMMLSPSALGHATVGMTEMPFTALMAAVYLLVWDMRRRPRFVLLGACLALAQLTRSVTVLLLPAVAAGILLLAPRGRRLRGLLNTLLVYLPALVAYAVYKWMTSGSPMAGPERCGVLAELAPQYTTNTVLRMIQPPDALAYVLAHPTAMVHKLALFGPRMLSAVLVPQSMILTLPFLLYLVTPPRDPVSGRFRIVLVLLMALSVTAAALTWGDPRYAFQLFPALIAIITSELWLLGRERNPGRGRIVAIVFALFVPLVMAGKTVPVWHKAWNTPATAAGVIHEKDWRDFGRAVAQRVPPQAVVVSDVGTWVTWYADRVSLVLPTDPEELARCDQRLPLDAMVLSNEWLVWLPGSEHWRALYEGTGSLPGWERADSIHCGALRAVVFLRTPAVVPAPR